MLPERPLVPPHGSGVLAPQSGGCARHVLSRRINYRIQPHGIEIQFDEPDPAQLKLLLTSTVTLHIVDEIGEWDITGQMLAESFMLKPKRAYFTTLSGVKTSIETTLLTPR